MWRIYWHDSLIHDDLGFNILSDTWSWYYYSPGMVLWRLTRPITYSKWSIDDKNWLEWRTSHMTFSPGKTWRTSPFTKATVRNLIIYIFCKTWLTIAETTVELISLVLFSLFGNGRRQMAALKCQRQGGHMLFCEQETWGWLTNNVCHRAIYTNS